MTAQIDLGTLNSTYTNPRIKRTLTTLGIGGVLIIASTLAFNIIKPGNDLLSFALIGDLVGAVLILVGLFTLPGALISLARNVSVGVYDNGFEHSIGAKKTRFLWSDIQSVKRQGLDDDSEMGGGAVGVLVTTAIAETRYIVKFNNDETLVLSRANLKKIDELGKRIQDEVEKQSK